MIDPKVIEELKAKYGEVLVMRAGSSEVVCRPVDRVRYQKFMRLSVDPAKRESVLDQLFRDCVVYPDMPAVEALLARKPFHAARFSDLLLKDAGAEDEAEKND